MIQLNIRGYQTEFYLYVDGVYTSTGNDQNIIYEVDIPASTQVNHLLKTITYNMFQVLHVQI